MEVKYRHEEIIVPKIKYEYHDHLMDLDTKKRLYAWGSTLKQSFEQCGIGMLSYLTDLDNVTINLCYKIEIHGTSVEDLLYRFLDELNFLLILEPHFICKQLRITNFNIETFEIVCRCYGERFNSKKHTEAIKIKEITYSTIKIVQKPEKQSFEVFVNFLL